MSDTPMIHAKDLAARLEELRLLRDGWLDGEGKAPSPAGLDWLAEAFDKRFPAGLELPRLYPTAQGQIRAEWVIDDHDASLVIDLGSRRGQWHDLNLRTDQEVEVTLDLGQPMGWERLVQLVRAVLGA